MHWKKTAAFALGLIATLAAGLTTAQGLPPMTGKWRGVYQGVTVDLLVTPDGRFSEQQRMGQMMTMQTGVIRPLGPNVVAFVVEDWQPRTRPVYHPSGGGGYTTQEANAKPPGGTWRVRLDGQGDMTMQDTRLGGAITFHRMR
jgi:hypothetical protein